MNFKLLIDLIIVSFNLYVSYNMVGLIDLGSFDYYFVYVVFFVIRSKLKFKIIFVKNISI